MKYVYDVPILLEQCNTFFCKQHPIIHYKTTYIFNLYKHKLKHLNNPIFLHFPDTRKLFIRIRLHANGYIVGRNS